MTTTREQIIVECDECGEPSAIHLMHHYWNKSVCVLCECKKGEEQ